MRVVTSLMMLLLCLSTTSAAQDHKTELTQSASQNREKTVTVSAKVARPEDSNCQPGTMSATTGLPSGGGTWTATWTFTIFVTCGNPILQSNVSWITPNVSQTTCSPSPEPLGNV